MGVNHSMNPTQVNQVLTQFEATTSAIQDIDAKVARANQYVSRLRDQREQLIDQAEVVGELIDNISDSLNGRSAEVLGHVTTTLETFAGPVEMLELSFLNMGLRDAPRVMQREFGPLMMPAVVLVMIITTSNSMLGFIVARDERISQAVSLEAQGFAISLSELNTLNLFAIFHVSLLGIAVVYIFCECGRRVVRRRRHRKKRGTKAPLLESLAADLFSIVDPVDDHATPEAADRPSAHDEGNDADVGRYSVSLAGSGPFANQLRASTMRLERQGTSGLAGSVGVQSGTVMSTVGSSGSGRGSGRKNLEPAGGIASAVSVDSILSDDDRLLIPSEFIPPAFQVGDEVVAKSGKATLARDADGTRKGWRLRAGDLAQVVGLDGEGDLRLRNRDGVESSWVRRELFVVAQSAEALIDATPSTSSRRGSGSAGGKGRQTGHSQVSSPALPARALGTGVISGDSTPSSSQVHTPMASMLRKMQEASQRAKGVKTVRTGQGVVASFVHKLNPERSEDKAEQAAAAASPVGSPEAAAATPGAGRFGVAAAAGRGAPPAGAPADAAGPGPGRAEPAGAGRERRPPGSPAPVPRAPSGRRGPLDLDCGRSAA